MSEEINITKLKEKIRIGSKLWLEFEGKSVLGGGWAKLLENIDKNDGGSLTSALNIAPKKFSYKYAWNILKRIEERTGFSPVTTGKGGPGGGGWVKLNKWGKYLLSVFKEYEKKLSDTLKDIQFK
ncbi:MAG: winged helix-turn-helix domain-containing protein [Promethearchaeota archaeon]